MRVLLSDQVLDFVRRPPPQPKARLRKALRALEEERGDIAALESPLDGYCRLRVGGYRVVFAYGKRGVIECIFAEQRSIVYELLEAQIREGLRGT